MADTCLNSIKFCALRVTALDALGNVASGPNNSYVTDRQIQLQFTGDVDDGKDLFVRGGCDQPLAAYKSPALLKRFTLQLDLSAIEPGLQSLLLGAPIITSGEDLIGFEWALQDCPSDSPPPLTAIEGWSYAWDCDSQDGVNPYWYWLFPMTQWSIKRAQTLQNDFATPQLDGFTRRNPLWGHGPYGGAIDWTTGAGGVVLTADAPPSAECGYQTVSPSS